MSVTCGFYNSVNHDRRYNAKQMSSIFDGIINDGVFMNIGDALATTANSGMVVNVGTGRAWFNHSWTYNDSVLPLTVPTSHSVLDRIDAVVLEVNESDEVRDNMIKIVTGTASSTPAKPALTNTKFVHQYALAYITVKGGATAITQANITINVGMSDCPYITGILKTISADVLFKQWSGEFGEWFENIKTQLSGDVAGNLQNQIGALSELKTTIKTNLVAAMNSIVNKLGSKDISKIGDGTVTGAILAQNQSLTNKNIATVICRLNTTIYDNDSQDLYTEFTCEQNPNDFNLFTAIVSGAYIQTPVYIPEWFSETENCINISTSRTVPADKHYYNYFYAMITWERNQTAPYKIKVRRAREFFITSTDGVSVKEIGFPGNLFIDALQGIK